MRIYEYAILLQSPLELGQFVPCKDGEPMEKPEHFNAWLKDPIRNGHFPLGINCENYQKALDRCLFKDWIYKDGYLESHQTGFSLKEMPWKTIEDVINADVDLFVTQTTLNLIKLLVKS